MLRGRLQEVEDTDVTTALWVSRDGCRASYGELKVEEFGDGESDFYCPNGRDDICSWLPLPLQAKQQSSSTSSRRWWCGPAPRPWPTSGRQARG